MLDQNYVLLNGNVRGLNNMARRHVVFDSVRDCRATIVALQETKLDQIDRQVVYQVLGSKFVENFVVLPAVGTRGGILLAVDEDHYTMGTFTVDHITLYHYHKRTSIEGSNG
jgi:hypothetical protein